LGNGETLHQFTAKTIRTIQAELEIEEAGWAISVSDDRDFTQPDGWV
jgi:hypothetical protein